MYAIIKTGGKQYRVQEGDVIDVELLGTEVGAPVGFNEVLLVHDGSEARVGHPILANYTVHGELIATVRAPKVIAFKYKKRKNYRRKVGHRQNYARVLITKIGG